MHKLRIAQDTCRFNGGSIPPPPPLWSYTLCYYIIIWIY